MRSPRRRAALGAMLAGLLSVSSVVHAQDRSATVDVVKILSFSCSVCLSSESQDRPISAAVRAQGGRFVSAPVPTHPEDKIGPRERVYYAARDMNSQLGDAVKASLYKGSQEQELPLYDFVQVYAWLSRDLPEQEAFFTPLFERAKKAQSQESLARALRLAIGSGVDALPTYLFIQNGRVVASLDPKHPQATSMTALRELVIAKIEELNKSNP